MNDEPPIDLNLASFAAIERAAAAILPTDVFEYYATGARDERTIDENVAAWAHWWLQPRRLTGVSEASTATTILGRPVSHPVIVAPTAGHGFAHPDAELATARAAASLGGVFILSTSSNVPLEDVAAVPGLDLWFQLYAFADEARTDTLLGRAVDVGARAIVLTVDVVSEADVRARPEGGFEPPADMTWAHHDGRSAIHKQLDWAFVRRLRERTPVPVVVKGILHPDDAIRAADEGVAAVIVSNHGGRFLDGSIPTALALPTITEALDDSIEVYVDGGVRRGGDFLRGLALGARAALIGRPILWGLAIDGQDGVHTVLARLIRELAEDAAFAGVADVTEVPRDLVIENSLRPAETRRRPAGAPRGLR